MNIGIDLSPLQGGSRMRGIGFTIINLINNLPEETKKKHNFVFYLEPEGQFKPLELLNTSDINYTTQELVSFKRIKNLPGVLRLITLIINKIRLAKFQYMGGSRYKNIRNVDVFLQTDQDKGLPKNKDIKTILVLYDIIPYIMQETYLQNFVTARKQGRSIKNSIRCQIDHTSYKLKIKLATSSATKMIAISNHTKDDYVKHFGVDASKITVVQLGVSKYLNISSKYDGEFNKATLTSWGYSKSKIDLNTKPFLLFVGGADPRRKLIDLVAAYNNLKAQGHDIRLVLAGDSMKNPDTVANINLQNYIKNNLSYNDDLIFLGFVTDEQRDWLYKNALAFVYPTVYEGFGLPILEAMQYGTPVITYRNTSIPEVAGDAAMYAKDFLEITDHVINLLNDPDLRKKYSKLGKKQASKFSWERTSEQILNILTIS